MTRRRKSVVATGVALVALVAALVAAVFVIPRDAGTAGAAEVPAPGSSASAAPSAGAPSPAEPAFKPGVPGLTTADVREHKTLWREFEELQKSEHSNRITIVEYRRRAIDRAAQFLQLRGAAAKDFTAAASGAVITINESFLKWRRTNGEAAAEEAQFSADLNAAVTRVGSLLKGEPRHRLFELDCRKWLLRLAFGPKAAKEAKEAAQRSKQT